MTVSLGQTVRLYHWVGFYRSTQSCTQRAAAAWLAARTNAVLRQRRERRNNRRIFWVQIGV
jgi:hypothetical protein